MILDSIRPCLAIIRIVGYTIFCIFLFSTGCTYGKRGEQAKTIQAQAERDTCLSANQANQSAIDALTEANKAYALESQKQAEAVAKSQKELKQAEKRAQAALEASKRKAKEVYRDNPQWSAEKVPDDIKDLLK